jgi:osmotically inducible lipoprotein OsmB
MVKSILAIVVLATTVGITGCATRAETIGTAGGAVAGGALGSAATGGSTIGTLGGAAAGAYLGDQAGKAYDRHNR